MLNYSNKTVSQAVWLSLDVFAFFLLFAEVILFALLVDLIRFIFRNTKNTTIVFQILGSFAGGVIVSAGFLHLLHEGLENFNEYTQDLHYPFGVLIVILIISLLLVNDKVINILLTLRSQKRDKINKRYSTPESPLLTQNSIRNCDYESSLTQSHHHEVKAIVQLGEEGIKSYSGIILVAAFSLHSVIEGLGLGSMDKIFDFAVTLVFISLHRTIGTLSIAVALMESNVLKKRLPYYLIFIIFALVEPISFAVGVILKELVFDHLITSIFQCLTAGTFIFIGLKEIIPLFFDSQQKLVFEICKIFSYCMGVAFVSCVLLLDRD
ncbi:Zinc transport protein [Oopsacas minuta]|uniref:Zinc transport protein n=1 Tax=Oopsacas minuta TaxID=111878 RepID=A0AAV7JY61_9METZ|nr:Zinc transport protein [Oopsacas minuta]